MAKLVSIGDSLVQGASSLAVSDTRNSFVGILARCLGLSPAQFRTPNFMGAGGLPFNIEWMVRTLERDFGNRLDWFEWPGATYDIVRLLDKVEDYYERGPGSRPAKEQLYHNLGVFGFQVADSWDITPAYCNDKLAGSRDEWFEPPSYGWLRIARRVLNPAFSEARMNDNVFDAAARVSQSEGGIDNLVVCLGANNCLSTVFNLLVTETGDDAPGPDSSYTLWSKLAFEKAYTELCNRITQLAPGRVFLATIPHVASLPVCQGVMADGSAGPGSDGVYDYAVPFWMRKDRFNPHADKFLSGMETRGIDVRIDEYNDIITSLATAHGYHVVDICDLFDRLSHHQDDDTLLPAPLKGLNTRLFTVNEDGHIMSGGLIGLDGIHPTVCGYGLMAQAFVEAFRSAGETVADVDFERLRQRDTLVSSPPRILCDVEGMLTLLETHFHFSRWLRLSLDQGIVPA